MLSVFPIMFLSLLAHTILRLFLGAALIYLGINHGFRHRMGLGVVAKEHWPRMGVFFVWQLAFVEMVLGALIFVGAWTQPAALLAAVLALKMIIFAKRFAHPAVPPRLFWIMVLAAGLSLTITGAGAFAFDLPL